MREILFRGKSIDDGKWKYSMSLARHATEDGIITSYYIGSGYDIVKAKTVGQYTGLTDKNGNKIFGGDIVKVCRGKDVEIGAVKCDERFAAYIVSFDKGKSCLLFFDIWQGIQEDNRVYIEVIGNIHDNPELLKGGEG